MTIAESMKSTSAEAPICVSEALSYEAPFLIDKLLKERIADDREDAEALFAEVKKYIVLDRMYPDQKFEMYSRRIDEVWHQFILFTTQYLTFCQSCFGHFLHHFPSNAPDYPVKDAAAVSATAKFDSFLTHYEAVFGAPLPELWFDNRSVSVNRRVLRDMDAGDLTIESEGEFISLTNERGIKLCVVNSLARPALEFIVSTSAFYVRELSGALFDDEKLALVHVLLSRRVLLLAP